VIQTKTARLQRVYLPCPIQANPWPRFAADRWDLTNGFWRISFGSLYYSLKFEQDEKDCRTVDGVLLCGMHGDTHGQCLRLR